MNSLVEINSAVFFPSLMKNKSNSRRRDSLRNDVCRNESVTVLNSQKEMNVHMHSGKKEDRMGIKSMPIYEIFDWINAILLLIFTICLANNERLMSYFPTLNLILFGYVLIMMFVKFRIIKF